MDGRRAARGRAGRGYFGSSRYHAAACFGACCFLSSPRGGWARVKRKICGRPRPAAVTDRNTSTQSPDLYADIRLRKVRQRLRTVPVYSIAFCYCKLLIVKNVYLVFLPRFCNAMQWNITYCLVLFRSFVKTRFVCVNLKM